MARTANTRVISIAQAPTACAGTYTPDQQETTVALYLIAQAQGGQPIQ